MSTNMVFMMCQGMNAVALVTTCIMCFHVGNRVTKKFYDQKIFLYMLLSTMAYMGLDSSSTILDMAGRADARWAMRLILMSQFIASPLPSFFWLRYCDFKLNNDRHSLLQRASIVGIPIWINALLSIASLSNHWIFWVDDQCSFQRGPLGWVSWAAALIYFPLSYLVIARKRQSGHTIPRKEQSVFFLLFPLPTILVSLLQYFVNISMIGVGMMFSTLLIFINIQNRKLYKDDLTGAFNRRHLEIHIEQMLRSIPAGKVAYVLMTDIDNFKSINDAHGNAAGDTALINLYALLRHCAPSDAVIARFGGDEYVLFGMASSAEQIEALRRRVEERLATQGANEDERFELQLTIGTAMYNPYGTDTSDDLLRRADDRLREIKRLKKQELAESLGRFEEYERLLNEATKGMYENIYELDITHDCACSAATREYFESLGLSGTATLNQAVRHIATKQFEQSYRKGYQDMFLPEKVLQAYAKGITKFSYEALYSKEGKPYHWIRVTARVFYWRYDHSVRMITFRQNIDEEKKRELEPLRKAEQLENELAQSRISIMLSQIQPHFLYNTLVVIKQLCDQDPQLAKDAIVEFSNYLRGNLDALTRKLPIPFDKELEHVENYLSLEKKRFGARINVVYNIETRDFLLPPLTVQPIVENAVRYGITKQTSGGTLTISTKEQEKAFVITVCDDGVGFDPKAVKLDGRTHTGIENVQNRLAAMCGGNLTVQSAIGEYTTATIVIPKHTARERRTSDARKNTV